MLVTKLTKLTDAGNYKDSLSDINVQRQNAQYNFVDKLVILKQSGLVTYWNTYVNFCLYRSI